MDEDSDAARFQVRIAAVESSPEFAEALLYRPRVSTAPYLIVTGIALGVAVSHMLLWVVALLLVPWPLVLVWLLMSGGFCWLAGRAFWAARRFARAPVVASVQVVLRTRTHISDGRGETGYASTTYFATLHGRGGDRTETQAAGSVVGRVVPGDVGVAYLKGGTLVHFRRFDV